MQWCVVDVQCSGARCTAVKYSAVTCNGRIFFNDQEHSISRLYLPKIYKILQRRLCYSSNVLLHAWGQTVVFWQWIFPLTYVRHQTTSVLPHYSYKKVTSENRRRETWLHEDIHCEIKLPPSHVCDFLACQIRWDPIEMTTFCMSAQQSDLPNSPGGILNILDFAKAGYSCQDTPLSGTDDPSAPHF